MKLGYVGLEMTISKHWQERKVYKEESGVIPSSPE